MNLESKEISFDSRLQTLDSGLSFVKATKSQLENVLRDIMKRLFPISLTFLLFAFFGIVSVSACTCVSLERDAFRNSKTVFLGTVVDSVENMEIKNYVAKVKFSVEKTWKGENRKEIEIYAETPNFPTGMCGDFGFEKGKKYLVYAETDRLLVQTSCAPSFQYEGNSAYEQKRVKQLDSFWYRLYARVNPF